MLDVASAASRNADAIAVLADACQCRRTTPARLVADRVERPHGLPTGKRQRRVRPGKTSAYRDVEYVGLGTVAELDGRLGHEETRTGGTTWTATSTA